MKFKKLISILLIIVMASTLSVYATTGGDADVGGEDTKTGEASGNISSEGKMLWSWSSPGGMKISLLFIGKGNYEPFESEEKNPALAFKTPTSIIGEGKPTGWDAIPDPKEQDTNKTTEGNWGIAPIYFIKGSIKDDREIGFTSDLKYYIYEGKTKKYLISDEGEVINAAQTVGAPNEIGESIYKAFHQDINGSVVDIQTSLKMVRWNDPDYNEAIHGKRNRDILNTIMQLMKDKHPELSSIIDRAMTYDNDYTILIEPITTLQKQGTNDYYLITPTAFQQAFLGTGKFENSELGNEIWGVQDISKFMPYFNTSGQDSLGEWLSYASRPILGRKDEDGNLTSRVDSTKNVASIPRTARFGTGSTYTRASIASKIAYAGPIEGKLDDKSDNHRAKFTNFRWGWGCLASPDFVRQDTKYVVISSGFINDLSNKNVQGTVATVDFIDLAGYLKGILPKLRQGAEYALLTTNKELNFTTYYDNNKQVERDIALEYFVTNFRQATNGLFEFYLKNYMTLDGILSELYEPEQYTEEEYNETNKLLDFVLNVRSLQFMIESGCLNSGQKKILGGYGDYDSSIVYAGNQQKLTGNYYRVYNNVVELNSANVVDAVGIDSKLEPYFKGNGAVPIAYIPSTLTALDVRNIPQTLITQIINEYTKDYLIELKNCDYSNGQLSINATENIIRKWLNVSELELNSIVNSLKNLDINIINAYNTDTHYGTFSAGKYHYIKVNEDYASLILAYILQDASKIKKVFLDDSGRNFNLSSIYTKIDEDNYTGIYGEITSNALTINNNENSTNRITTSSVEAVTRMASTEASLRSELSLVKNNDETLNMNGSIGASIILYEEGIPLDKYIVMRNRRESYLLAPIESNVMGVVDIKKSDIINVNIPEADQLKVSQAIIKPASVSMEQFLSQADFNMDHNMDYVNAGSTRAEFVKPQGDAELLEIEFVLTKEDRQYYEADPNNRPAILIYVEQKDEIKQVNIIDKIDGTTDTDIIDPVVSSSNTIQITVPTGLKLEEWKLSEQKTNPFDDTINWSYVSGLPGNSGTTNTNVSIDTSKTQILYVHYSEIPSSVVVSGDIEIPENVISKSISLSDIGALQTFTFSYGSAGYHEHSDPQYKDPLNPKKITGWTYYDVSRSCTVDSKYNYIVDHTIKRGDTIAKSLSINFNGTNKKSGDASWSGGSNSLSPNLAFTVWRHNDIPTLASYKYTGNIPNILNTLGISKGIKPSQNRSANGYQSSIEIGLNVSNSGDYSTTFECRECSSRSTQKHRCNINTATYPATIAVKSYIGKANAGVSTSTYKTSSFKIGTTTFSKVSGVVIPNTKYIKFYPYVEMLYGTTGGAVNQTANVLAAHESSIRPVDYVDIGWFNANPTTSLSLNSDQWTLHARAKQWGTNNVLPGGAMYSLDTRASTTKLGVTTWQTYIPNDLTGAVTDGGSYFSLASVQTRDADLNTQIRASIEGLNIVQYIDSDTNKSKTNAFSGVELKPGGNQTVLGQKTSTDAKYWLKNNTASNRTDEGDLDIIGVNNSVEYYRVRSDVQGRVYIESSSNGSTWSNLQTLQKNQGISALSNAIAVELNNKTQIVTNFLAALDRNQGSGTWYNEAWDGICVVKTSSIYDIGFADPAVRAAVIDPKLCPIKTSVSDIFTKANISQFKLAGRSSIRVSEQNGYVGELNGVDIIIPDITNMYQSKPFYIPNATVMDLY